MFCFPQWKQQLLSAVSSPVFRFISFFISFDWRHLEHMHLSKQQLINHKQQHVSHVWTWMQIYSQLTRCRTWNISFQVLHRSADKKIFIYFHFHYQWQSPWNLPQRLTGVAVSIHCLSHVNHLLIKLSNLPSCGVNHLVATLSVNFIIGWVAFLAFPTRVSN